MENYGSERTPGKRPWKGSTTRTLVVATSAGVAGAAAASLLIALWGEYQRQPDLATTVLESRVRELEELRPLVRSYGEIDRRLSALEAVKCEKCEIRAARNAPEFVGMVLATLRKNGDGLTEDEVVSAVDEHAASFSKTDLERLQMLRRNFARLQATSRGRHRQTEDARLDIGEIREALF